MPSRSLSTKIQTAGLRPQLMAKDVARRAEMKEMTRAQAVDPKRRNDLLPRLSLVDRDPHALTTPARNVRKITPGHVREVANSILALGFTVPVLVDADGVILDGAVRVEAAKQLGLLSVPCVLADHLTVAERKLLRIASNRLAEKGAWDLEELKIELEALIIDEAPIEISGLESFEIDGILASDASPVERGPIEPEPGAVAISALGDVYILGPHRIVCGDARDPQVLKRVMGDDLARFVATDQPYNVKISGFVTGGKHREFGMASGEMTSAQFDDFNFDWIKAAICHVVEGGALATFIDWRGIVSVTRAATANGLTQLNLIVWSKTNAGMGSLYRSQHELMPLFKKGDAPHINNVDLGQKGRWRSNVWSYAGASSIGSDARRGLKEHPTVKPTMMLEDALRDLTNRGDVVLDPFLGSGSTLMAAETTGRVCRGVELDPLYLDVVIRRYERATGCAARLEDTGETFGLLEERRLVRE